MEQYSELLNSCLDSLKNYNKLIDTHLKDNEYEEAKTNLKNIVKQYCQIDFNIKKSMKIAEESIKEFEQELNLDETTTIKTELPNYNQLDEIYQRKLNEDCTILENIETHDIWKDIMIGESNRDVEAIENNNADTLPDSAFEPMNDSLMCSNVFTPPIDPISKIVIKQPYRNKTCGHVYEYQSILQYIKSMKNKAKCPYMGCNNNKIAVKDLQKDDNMRKRIDDYLKSRESPSNTN